MDENQYDEKLKKLEQNHPFPWKVDRIQFVGEFIVDANSCAIAYTEVLVLSELFQELRKRCNEKSATRAE